jgi:hypothetical protein
MTWKCSRVSVALHSVILILAWPITFGDKGRPNALALYSNHRLVGITHARGGDWPGCRCIALWSDLRERSILRYATIVPRYRSNEEGTTFGLRARLYATFLSQTMMGWPSAQLPYQSNTLAASNLNGNGSEFVFHESMLPIVISHSDRVTLRNFSIDYASPHIVQAKVVSKNDGFVDLHIDSRTSYRVKDDRLFIVAENAPPGSEQVARGSVVFDPEGKWLVAGTGDNWEVDKTTAKRIDRDDVRLFGLTQQTRLGDVLILWNGDRPNPGRSQLVGATPSDMNSISKGGVYGTRKTEQAFH